MKFVPQVRGKNELLLANKDMVSGNEFTQYHQVNNQMCHFDEGRGEIFEVMAGD